jgi:hypothetical protein
MKLPTRDQLVKRRAILIADAQMKLECADWHGCADACMDLREIDAQISLFDELREEKNDLLGRSDARTERVILLEPDEWIPNMPENCTTMTKRYPEHSSRESR